MIETPYCKEHYSECPCSHCAYDKENCCGCAAFSSYVCPMRKCIEFKEKPKEHSHESKTEA